MYEEVKKLQESHGSWGSIKKALLEKFDYEESKGRNKGVFDQWVTSLKIHQSAMHTFLDFVCHFAQLLKRNQRLVGDG